MSKKLTISFKENKKDLALFNFIMGTDDKSFYVKEAMRQVFSNEIEKELQKLEAAENKKETFFDTIDFEAMERERRVNPKPISFEDRRKQPFNYTNEEN